MTTFQALRRTVYAGRSAEATKSAVRRLREAKYICPAPLIRKKSYYRLTKRAARLVDGPAGRGARYLDEHSKASAYALLCFCLLREEQRHRFTCHEVRERFPAAVRQRDYYVDRPASADAAERIGVIIYDQGGQAVRIVQKVERLVSAHLARPGFRELMQGAAAPGMVFTVLTALEQKAEQMLRYLSASFGDAAGPRVYLRCVAVPELEALLPKPRPR